MSGRHAFVTGAGSGIGKAIALALAAEGHVISLAGRRAGPLETVRDGIRAAQERLQQIKERVNQLQPAQPAPAPN